MTYEIGTWPWEQGPETALADAAGEFEHGFDLAEAARELVDKANEVLGPYGITTTVSGLALRDEANGADASLEELESLLEEKLDYPSILEHHPKTLSGLLVPVSGIPEKIDIKADECGSTLHALQELVGGNIEPFNVIFGDDISLYVNEEGLYACPPNRAVYATKSMEDDGYISQMDYTTAVKEGELYTILFGDIVAVGFDPETGADRDLTEGEMVKVESYFTEVSAPGSGLDEVIAIRRGAQRDSARPSLKEEAEVSRAAAGELDLERGGAPEREDRSI